MGSTVSAVIVVVILCCRHCARTVRATAVTWHWMTSDATDGTTRTRWMHRNVDVTTDKTDDAMNAI